MTNSPAKPGQPRRSQSPAQSGQLSIDPVKLLKKYYLLLVVAGMLATVAAVATFILLGMFAPRYTATAIFEARTPSGSVTDFNAPAINNEELERFMQSQANVMTSDQILSAVARDVRVLRQAPNWAAQFQTGTTIDATKARQSLQNIVGAGVVPRTNFVRLSVSWKNPEDAAGLTGLVREEFTKNFNTYSRSETRRQIDQLSELVAERTERIQALANRRDDILRQYNVESIDLSLSQSREQMVLIARERQEVNLDRIKAQERLDEYRRRIDTPGELVFDDALVSEVEQLPLIQNQRREINALKGALQAARGRGLGDRHRDVRELSSRVRGAEQTLEALRQEELDQAFQGQIESLTRAIDGAEAQIVELDDRAAEAQIRNTELTQIAQQISDIKLELDAEIASRQQLQATLDEFQAKIADDESARIILRERERTPDERSFPQARVVLPGVFLLIMGTVVGLILVRELLDQRVKSAGDIAAMTRVPLFGALPDTGEDPSQPESAARVVLDNPDSVMAESFRQLRPNLLKKLGEAGHKSLAVVGCAPGAGSTSVAVGLASAVASVDHRVLLIDANLRRPSLHDLFDRARAPGLTEILSDQSTLDDALLSDVAPGLDLIPVGSAELRKYERLGGERIARLLEEAGKRYDLVVVDVAPAIVAGDAFSVASRVNATLLVARALREKRGLVGRISGELADSPASFMGVVVNGVRASAGGYLKSNIRTAHRYQTALT